MPPDAPSEGPPALPPGALLLTVADGDLLVGGGSGGGAPAPLMAGLPPGTAARAEEGGALVLGLSLPEGERRTAQADFPLGHLRDFQRWMALAKTSLWWMSPRWGCGAATVPVETQFLLLELPPEAREERQQQAGSRAAGSPSAAPSAGGAPPPAAGPPPAYALLLPLIDGGRFRATLRPPKVRADAGRLVLRLESGSAAATAATWPSALLVVAGWEPYELVARGVAAAVRLSGIGRPRVEKAVPPSVDVFGWCTWDAFYSMVSASGISEGLRSLGAGGVPPRLLIIDDGWQQTDVDPAYRAIAAQRHLVGQVSVPHTQSELEVEDAVMDLILGPSDERETNTRHTMNAEEDEILGFTPRAQTPRRAAAANPFGLSPSRSAGLLSPSRLLPGFSPRASSLRASPLQPRPASAEPAIPSLSRQHRGEAGGQVGAAAGLHVSFKQQAAQQGGSGDAEAGPAAPVPAVGAAGSLPPPLSLARAVAEKLHGEAAEPPAAAAAAATAAPGEQAGAAPGPQAGLPAAPPEAAAGVASPLRAPAGLPRISAPHPKLAGGEPAGAAVAVEHAAAAAAAEAPMAQQAAEAGAYGAAWWDALHHAEAQALRLMKSWLDSAKSDSWRFRAFCAAATTLLRPTLLRFYARATEHTRRLAGVRANAKFGGPAAGPDSGDLNSTAPEGSLGQVVADLKQRFGLTHVFCWHALLGFWAGVAPAGAGNSGSVDKYSAQVLYPRPTPGTLEIDPSYAWQQSTLGGVGLPASPTALHADMHSYLKACGVDGVKVDVQGMVAHVGTATAGGGPALAAAYHASLEASAAESFGGAVINCMCGSSENMYNMRDSNLGRVSDDFYPRNRASFTTHISTCAFASLFCGELYIPDWDMFHSKHPAALLHATARAISGGPLYISDKPGQHDFGLLRRLVLPEGSVLRCLLPGRPSPSCLFLDVNHDNTSALKVWSMNPCGGVLAAFNVQGASWSTPRRGFHFHNSNPPAVTASVGPADVPGLVPLQSGDGGGAADGVNGGGVSSGGSGESRNAASGAGGKVFAVYIDSRQDLLLMGPHDSLPLELAPGGGCELLTLAAMQAGPAGLRCAPIGLVNMLNAGGAVTGCGWESNPSSSGAEPSGAGAGGAAEPSAGASGGAIFLLATRGRGVVLAYCSAAPAAVEMADGAGIRFDYDAEKGALSWETPPGLPLALEWLLRF